MGRKRQSANGAAAEKDRETMSHFMDHCRAQKRPKAPHRIQPVKRTQKHGKPRTDFNSRHLL